MKRLLLITVLFAGLIGQSQTPTNYTKIAARYDWIAGKFDSTLTIPFGATTGLKGGGYNGAGGLFFNTTTKQFQAFDGSYFRRFADSIYKSGSDLIIRYGNVTQTISDIGGGSGNELVDNSGQRYAQVKTHTEEVATYSGANVFTLSDGRIAKIYTQVTSAIDLEPGHSITYIEFSSDDGSTWEDAVEVVPENVSGDVEGSGSYYFAGDSLKFIYWHWSGSSVVLYQRASVYPYTTWSGASPKFIPPNYVATVGNRVIRASSNRLYLPYNLNTSGGPESTTGTYVGKLLKSDDNGVTWSDMGVTWSAPDNLFVENGVQEADGTLYGYARGRSSYQWYTESTDGVTGTAWTAVASSGLPSPNAGGAIIYDSVNRVFVAVVNQPLTIGDATNSLAGRYKLAIYTSFRDFTSWEYRYLVDMDSGFHFINPTIAKIKDKYFINYTAGYDYGGSNFQYDLREKIIPVELVLPTSNSHFNSELVVSPKVPWTTNLGSIYAQIHFASYKAPGSTNYGIRWSNALAAGGAAVNVPEESVLITTGQDRGYKMFTEGASISTTQPFRQWYYTRGGAAVPTSPLYILSQHVSGDAATGKPALTQYSDGRLYIQNPTLGTNDGIIIGHLSADGNGSITNTRNDQFDIISNGTTMFSFSAAGAIKAPPLATGGADEMVVADTDGNLTTQAISGGSISGLTSGRVVFATGATSIGDDADFLFNGTQLSIAGNTSGNSLKVGTLGMQSFAVNNAAVNENIEFNGSNWVAIADGLTNQIYMGAGAGDIQFRQGGSLLAGQTVTSTIPFKTNNNGTVGIGGNINGSTGVFSGSTMIVDASNIRAIPLAGTGDKVVFADIDGDLAARALVQSDVTNLVSDLAAKVPTSRTITINGTTQDLSANRTWTLPTFTEATLTTSNATPTSILTYATATNERGAIEVTIAGVKSNGDGITGKKIVGYKNIAGTLSLSGSVEDLLATVADGDLSTATWAIGVSDDDVVITVTGIAATSIEWKISYKITKITPPA